MNTLQTSPNHNTSRTSFLYHLQPKALTEREAQLLHSMFFVQRLLLSDFISKRSVLNESADLIGLFPFERCYDISIYVDLFPEILSFLSRCQIKESSNVYGRSTLYPALLKAFI